MLPISLRRLQNATGDLVVRGIRQSDLMHVSTIEGVDRHAGKCHQDRRMCGDDELRVTDLPHVRDIRQKRQLLLGRERVSKEKQPIAAYAL